MDSLLIGPNIPVTPGIVIASGAQRIKTFLLPSSPSSHFGFERHVLKISVWTSLKLNSGLMSNDNTSVSYCFISVVVILSN